MAILSSHKNQVTYIEYAKIVKADEKVAFIQENKGTALTFALPYGNTAVLLLGPGTSITQAAMHHLCSEGCLVGFTGGDGFPAFAGSLSEYRPTEYLQAWCQKYFSGLAWKLQTARHFQSVRVRVVNEAWPKLGLSAECLEKARTAGETLLAKAVQATTKEELLGFEANYAKALYASLAKEFDVNFTREAQKKQDYVNDLIDAHNYYAYGIAGVTLWTLGIPPGLPVLHGDTRRGALVFDVADMIKDGLLLPLAFISLRERRDKSKHKKACADTLNLANAMNLLYKEIKYVLD